MTGDMEGNVQADGANPERAPSKLETVHDEPPGLKACSLCAEPIPAAAIKCRHCDGYQGRWFFLNLSAPVLSLLVALVSILSLALPTMVEALRRPGSDVRVAFQYFENGTAYFVASNGGTRAGSVGEVYLDYGRYGERHVLRGVAGGRFVPPGAHRQLAFRLPCPREEAPQVEYAQDAKWGSRPIAKDARLAVVVVQFDGTSQTQSTAIGALSGIQAITDRHARCVVAELRGAAK
ncbi:hypothetical protein [Sphingomonas sp. TX0522]|jgi:hypothetical protein|uniref:hypothetical protein n=1 Tax=Sphingomonas sp. TX0522 TaxID=2479205 RepID=UPI0018DF50D2|nr:hypothetical protein [Sphingomonas sp. TX0522]